MTSSPVPTTPNPARPQRRMSPWLIRIPILLFTGTVLLLTVLAVFMIAFQLRFVDRIYPGVMALGVDLSGMSLEEATDAIESRFEYGSQAVFTFRDGDRFWQMTASELGVGFDAQATAQFAFDIGHSGNLLRDVPAQALAWFQKQAISPVITYDQNIAVARLTAIADEINRSPVNATLTLDGTRVRVTESQTGRRLDIAATLARINNVISQLTNGAEIPLVINETPALVSSVAQPAEQLQAALSGPLTLTATDPNGAQLGPWTMSVDQIASLLRVIMVNNGDGTQSYEVDIDMGAFEGFLNQLAPGLITPAIDGRFDFDPNTGQLAVIASAQSGRTLNITETVSRLEEAVFSADSRIVPMAFDSTLPRYHNQISATELGIRELVAEATTYYEGSDSARRHNIAVGVSRVNGVIIAPGEEFSFNYYIGDIGPENDFVEGLVIFGGRTVDGYGGGICQVSTNIFRAAFTGGYAITERNSHGYRVGYYELRGQPAGFDAAIWQPERDFRFQNNTPYYVLVEASIFPGDNALQVRLYSTRYFRVEIDQPIIRDIVSAPPPRFESNPDLQLGQILQVDYAADGADVTIYRRVFDLTGNMVIQDYAYTHYLPWQAIYQVAPNDSRLLNQSG